MSGVVITGLGIVSAAGRGLGDTCQALWEDRSGLGRLTLFESPRNGELPVAQVAGRVDGPRTLGLAQGAMDQAIEMAGLDAATSRRAGLTLGTCVAGMPETEAAMSAAHRGDGMDYDVLTRHECGYLASQLAARAAVEGPVTTLSSACSSSAQAIAAAADLLTTGVTEVALAGGADALCRLTLNGFASLLNISSSGCRPFDSARSGMSLGEGAAFLVLESTAHAARRNAAPIARLLGYGNTCDAHHPTAPHPEGLGAEGAMRAALQMAGLRPSDVDYINAHGTGTIENDAAEGAALHRMFGEHPTTISSTKRVFGHTLGAAGAIEAVVSILAMRDNMLPGTAGLHQADPRCMIQPVTKTIPGSPRVVMSNSFGFGGNNSSLCLAAPGFAK